MATSMNFAKYWYYITRFIYKNTYKVNGVNELKTLSKNERYYK